MKWNKVEHKLPTLHYISDNWTMSDAVLAMVEGKYPIIARLNSNNGPAVWNFEGRGNITHWTYVELPNE